MILSQLAYPASLLPIQASVLSHPQIRPDERRRLLACRFHSGCNSSVCPSCIRKAGFIKRTRLVKNSAIVPADRLKFGTFFSTDVDLGDLRSTAAAIMTAARAVLRKVKISDYALAWESSPVEWSSQHHPHVHFIADVPAGGRRHVSVDTWNSEWLTALPSDLRPSSGGTKVTVADNAEAVASYLTTSPFAKSAHVSNADVHRIVDGILAVRDRTIQRFNLRGSFLAA